jgi:hypothetical protein
MRRFDGRSETSNPSGAMRTISLQAHTKAHLFHWSLGMGMVPLIPTGSVH